MPAQQGTVTWGGLVSDSFALEVEGTVKIWTAEDGGRIRHSADGGTTWTFQTTPSDVLDRLQRVFFLNSTHGWAVGQGGVILATTNGGTTWTKSSFHLDGGSQLFDRMPNQAPGVGANENDPYEELYDIHFLPDLAEPTNPAKYQGWLIGVHSMWQTTDSGANWTQVVVLNADGVTPYSFLSDSVEMYAIDIVRRPDDSMLGLACGQPGVIFRSTDATLSVWQLVWRAVDLCLDGCPNSVLQPHECVMCGPISGGGGSGENVAPWFEAWDIEIGASVSPKLALMVGGFGNDTGFIFSSSTDGAAGSWVKEKHECMNCPTVPVDPDCNLCATNPAYNQAGGVPYRLTFLRTLYGVGIFNDNTAIASAYNGQHVVRDPATGLWADRSSFWEGVPLNPDAVVFPLIGAEALTFSSTGQKLGFIVGEGGYIRKSLDGGQTWSSVVSGGPQRINDVWFKDNQNGWQVGQFFRVGVSSDSGVNWQSQIPFETPDTNEFRAISIKPDGDHGVVVGGLESTLSGNRARIRYTDSGGFGTPGWQDAAILSTDSFIDGKPLNEVTYAGGDDFWAVGVQGLILKSVNNGAAWRLVLPEDGLTLREFEMHGVAFIDQSTGLICGVRSDAGVVYQYQHLSGGSPTWTALSIPSNPQARLLTDVAIFGNTAWAVGEKLVGAERAGIVLTGTAAGGSFSALTEDPGPPGGFPKVYTGKAYEDIPVLNEVEVCAATGEVWVGGACGRLWKRSVTGTWQQVKSGTDAHIVGLSFPSATGYVAGMRKSQTQQCVTRIE